MENNQVFAIVGDNACNDQAAIQQVTDLNSGILSVLCATHILNLIIGNIFSKLNVAKRAISIIDSLIKSGLLSKYSIVRWNSRYDSICSALEKNLGSQAERIVLMNAKLILSETSTQLSAIQKDGSNAADVLHAFSSIRKDWLNYFA